MKVNSKEEMINDITVDTIELENFNLYLKDFDSILEDTDKSLTETLNKVELDSIKKDKILRIYTNLNTYRESIFNVYERLNDNHKHYQKLLKEHPVEFDDYKTAFKHFKTSAKKYIKIIDFQSDKCEEFLFEECESSVTYNK